MRKRKKKIISLAGVVMSLVLCFLLGAGQILAEHGRRRQTESLAIQYGGGAAEFSLYRVADMTGESGIYPCRKICRLSGIAGKPRYRRMENSSSDTGCLC